MITGIIGAMQVEIEALKNMVEQAETRTVSGIEFVKGRIGGHEVVVASCGIGKVFAAMCAQTMIVSYGVDRIINTGVAGTLSEKLGLTELAIATAVVQHDMDTSAVGDPVGMISGINQVELPASAELAEELARCAETVGVRSVRGVIASGDRFVADAETKSYIQKTFGAIACEMEGAAIGQVCYVNQIPFAVIRCISDNADDAAGTMEYPELCKKAAEQSQQLLQAYFS